MSKTPLVIRHIYKSRSTRNVKGKWERLCRGPAHDEPTWLPESEKYFFIRKNGERAGQPLSVCRLCDSWDRLRSPGVAGYVPVERVLPFFEEGVNRLGKMELARRAEISRSTLNNVLTRKYKFVQKRIVRQVMLQVISARRKNEARHRDSIRHGANARGKVEKKIVTKLDYYKPNGDEEMYRGRRRRAG